MISEADSGVKGIASEPCVSLTKLLGEYELLDSEFDPFILKPRGAASVERMGHHALSSQYFVLPVLGNP